MNKELGYKNTLPVIDSVRFESGKIFISLVDGRTLSLPLSHFPDIQKLSPSQKRKHSILAGTGLMFDDINTVYHVSDFMGTLKESSYDVPAKENIKSHSMVAETKVKYKKK